MACAAIGPGSLFGLVTFSHKIGLYDVQGPIPVVKHIMIPADMDGHIPVHLEMAMPLCAFLAPVCCTSSLYSHSVWSFAFDGCCKHCTIRCLFVITNEYADLALLKYLSIESGGCLLLYSNTNEATLLQDLYCMLSQPYAFGCGLLWPFLDPQYGNVQHIICCDQYATCAFDFGFSNSTGFTRNQDSPPVLQLTIQYSILVRCDDGARRSSADGNYRIKSAIFSRYHFRQSINVLLIGVAANYAELYESAQPEVILTVLTHKVIQASLEDGVKEACALLHDWLVILTAQYIEYNKLAQFGQPDNMDDQMHFPWGMTQSFAFLCWKSSALEPFDLIRAVHPVLSSYATPDKQAYPQHSLSQAALITSGSPIFFLDAFTCLIVYYSPTADPALPFPPPQNCK
ncbi:unnamed protein product [Sphagnum troendelagicum]|uniref:Uncharacterized protein n=1 Tax=Sphagnum troendelagicum TaxID=128251 RepID=A0ABP0TL30_9BRYO